MKPFPLTNDYIRMARRVIWFESPEQALADPVRFVAYAMAKSTPEDMDLILQHIGQDGLRESIKAAPPGIVDARSWAYWNLMADIEPALPIPQRRFSDLGGQERS